MSPNSKEMLAKVRKMIPPMLGKFHKGQLGRVAVIGGSEDYTGAPYFSAMASARLGADMSHIICEPLAAAVIKTYSPNLMVHPLMRSQSHSNPTVSDPPASQIAEPIISMLSRLHVLVIGPGLGRDSLMQETCALVITAARERSLPFVLDADGLYLAQTRPELVQGYPLCILTPNVVEFARLAKSKGITISNDNEDQAGELARAFGGVTVLQKGAKDYISNGETSYVSDGEGGRKRSGGQGDTLTGSLATFLAWRKAYLDRIWDHDNALSPSTLFTLATFAGSALTRECSRLAFQQHGRALQASDLTEQVPVAFRNLFGEAEGEEWTASG